VKQPLKSTQRILGEHLKPCRSRWSLVNKYFLCFLSEKIASGYKNLPNSPSDWWYFSHAKIAVCWWRGDASFSESTADLLVKYTAPVVGSHQC